LVEPLARVIKNLGVKNALVVYGLDGLDEISLSSDTSVCELKNGVLKKYILTPEAGADTGSVDTGSVDISVDAPVSVGRVVVVG
jgi:anthranilate phosphoribosyltransferase